MKETTSIETGYLCHCLRITAERFERILDDEPAPNYPLLKEKYCIGTKCSSCEYEAKGVLNDYLLLHPDKNGRKAVARPRGLRADLRFAWKQLRDRISPPAPKKKKQEPASKAYHTGIFFMRRDGLESHLVVSNLRFPEHARNLNGQHATFRARLFGEDGGELGVSSPVTVADGQSLELSAQDLFPELKGDFTGGLYVDYDELAQTGSLRPYGVMVNTAGDFGARCHYHDKFGLQPDPGYFQNAAPLEPGQDCWMALSNCQPLPYDSAMWLKAGGKKYSAPLHVAPMASLWVKLEDFFPELDIPESQRSPALLWLDNPQHVMVYFFWYHRRDRTWMGQHH